MFTDTIFVVAARRCGEGIGSARNVLPVRTIPNHVFHVTSVSILIYQMQMLSGIPVVGTYFQNITYSPSHY